MRFAPKRRGGNPAATSRNIDKLNTLLGECSRQYKSAIDRNDFAEAYRHMLKAYSLAPGHAPVIMELAYTELRLGRHKDAYQHYLKAIQVSQPNVATNIYDGMTEVCHFLGKEDDMRTYGALALQTKRQQVIDEPVASTCDTAPPPFNPQQPGENIIAYSLYGGLPRYCETALINVTLARQIYPEWTCRFYVDDTVPGHIRQQLTERGAQVQHVSAAQKELSGLYWRFLVMDDPDAKRFLIRDADSLVSYRERAAVDEWLASGKWFHTMRDSYTHTELILAGMWGGTHGIFHNIEQMVRDFIQTGRFLTTRVMDQHFLRYCIWPTLTRSVCRHDSQGFEADAFNFPAPAQQTDFEQLAFHVGMNEGASTFSVAIQHPTASKVRWQITDEHGQAVCAYDAVVPASRKITVDIPRHYGRKIEAGNWSVKIYPYETPA